MDTSRFQNQTILPVVPGHFYRIGTAIILDCYKRLLHLPPVYQKGQSGGKVTISTILAYYAE